MSEERTYGEEITYCFACGQPVFPEEWAASTPTAAPAPESGADDRPTVAASSDEGLAVAEKGAARMEAVLAFLEERGYLPPSSESGSQQIRKES